LGLSLFWVMGKWSSAAAGQHRPKPPAKALRKALRAARRAQATPQRVTVATSGNDDNKEPDGSDEYVAAVEHDFKCPA
jgi:hypothetical protein